MSDALFNVPVEWMVSGFIWKLLASDQGIGQGRRRRRAAHQRTAGRRRAPHLRAQRGGRWLHADHQAVERRARARTVSAAGAPVRVEPVVSQGGAAPSAVSRRGRVEQDPEARRGRKTAATPRPEAEWLRIERPDLRIVSDDVWHATRARLRGQQRAVTPGRRPPRDIESKYLLSGFARCGTCGGTLSVVSRGHGRKRAYFYGCLAHAKRGATVCDNALVLPVARVDDAVLVKLASDVLRPAVVRAVIDGVFDAMRPTTIAKSVDTLRAELKSLDRKIANLTEAIENGGAVAPSSRS